jgi:phosphoribosylanthranilate isomerase
MRREDIRAALDYGADALGFVVGTPPAQRNLQFETARRLMKGLPPFATKVAVTTTSDPKLLNKICALNPNALQLHTYDPRILPILRKRRPEMKIILATPIRDHQSLSQAEKTSKYSDAVLADSPGHWAIGGTGRSHDWKLTAELQKRIRPHPLILAGGLTVANVRSAVEIVQPYAVDVSSGVEKQIGVKDHLKMKEFIANAKG